MLNYQYIICPAFPFSSEIWFFWKSVLKWNDQQYYLCSTSLATAVTLDYCLSLSVKDCLSRISRAGLFTSLPYWRGTPAILIGRKQSTAASHSGTGGSRRERGAAVVCFLPISTGLAQNPLQLSQNLLTPIPGKLLGSAGGWMQVCSLRLCPSLICKRSRTP